MWVEEQLHKKAYIMSLMKKEASFRTILQICFKHILKF